jgi:sulfatase modifying factor 1
LGDDFSNVAFSQGSNRDSLKTAINHQPHSGRIVDRKVMRASPATRIEAIEPVMARVPEGWFWMGCEIGRDDENPVHRVWVDAFELAAYQVTNEEYACFLAAMRYPQPLCWNDSGFNHPKMPVVAVSWHEAATFCQWLSRATGKSYRLPSEAEWERAARGGAEHLLYSWGDGPPEQLPNYAGRWKSGPEPVGTYSPNPYGLYNLGDNVHEWCGDWYNADYYGCSPERNPRGPSHGSRRASRGGSWRHQVKVTRTAARSSIPPEFKYADYGFRIARSLPGDIL